jgi:hypothetical protein
MNINPVQLLKTEKLHHNSENPKKPLGLRYKRGLRAGLEEFGFAGVLVVAADDDGTYEVLDGNTRLEELEREGVEEIPCVVLHGLSREDRQTFVLTHDRNRKIFNEDVVLAQLQGLAERGKDVHRLGVLVSKENLARLLQEKAGASFKPPPGAPPAAATSAMGSLVLYGPAVEIKAIGKLLKDVKGKLSFLEKARKTLGQAVDFLDWQDEKLLACLLSAIGRFGEADDGPSSAG